MMNFQIDCRFKFRVVLCRIRRFPTLISKIKCLESGLPLTCNISWKLYSLGNIYHLFFSNWHNIDVPKFIVLFQSFLCCFQLISVVSKLLTMFPSKFTFPTRYLDFHINLIWFLGSVSKERPKNHLLRFFFERLDTHRLCQKGPF